MWRIAGFTGAVGLEVALAIVIGTWSGQWLDRKLGTAPVFIIIGFAAGIGAAIKALIRVTRDYKKNIQAEDQHPVSPITSSPASSPAPAPHPPKDSDEPHGRH